MFLYKAVIYQQNGIIDLVNSKVTIVCAIMTCFINYDVINLYDVMSYILISKRFVSGEIIYQVKRQLLQMARSRYTVMLIIS